MGSNQTGGLAGGGASSSSAGGVGGAPSRAFEDLRSNGNMVAYLLHKPPANVSANLDIVFLHGLQLTSTEAVDAFWSTWAVRDKPGSCWPADWLPRHFPTARILAVRHPAKAVLLARESETHWEAFADKALNLLTLEPVLVGDDQRRIVLVGHDVGGLLLKEVILRAHFLSNSQQGCAAESADGSGKPTEADKVAQAAKRLLDGLSGVVFYGTPHQGCFLPEWTEAKLSEGAAVDKALLDSLKVFNKSTALLQGRYERIADQKKVQAICFAEQEKTNLGKYGWKEVVPQATAALNAADGTTKFVNADHFNVCKPPSDRDTIYLDFISYVETATGVAKRSDKEVQEQKARAEEAVAVL